MSAAPLILGTRGSDLALAQARMVQAALDRAGIAAELRVIRTIGDKRPDLRLSEFSAGETAVHDKGIFTKELEEALLAGEIDFAVHSLKDVPTELGAEFEICATLPRAPVSDVVLSTRRDLIADLTGYDESPHPVGSDHGLVGETVATSSVRRARLLGWRFPGVEVVDIRGNVPTRIRKLTEEPSWAAIILARAGLERLGFFAPDEEALRFEGPPVFCAELSPGFFPPAASQGAVAMEILGGHARAREALAQVNDEPTFRQITAERSFLAALQAGCQTPVGIHTEFRRSGDVMTIRAVVFSEKEQGDPATAIAEIPVEQADRAGEILLGRLQ